MFTKNKSIIAVVVLLIAVILGSQTFLPTGFFNDSIRVFASIYGSAGSKTVLVTGITLNQKTLNIKVKQQIKLIATLKPANSTRKTPSWFSSNKKVATVAKDGTITAVGNGTTIITAFTETQFADCTVNVAGIYVNKPVSVTGVAINAPFTLALNTTKQLVATIKPANATNKTLTWTSSSSSIVSVDAKGIVTAKKIGKATITVRTKDGAKAAKCEVTVIKPVSVTGVAIDKALTLKIKATKQLVAAIKPANATNKALTWSSSSAFIASVDANGKIIANKVGKAIITVKTKDGSKTSQCTVTVVK